MKIMESGFIISQQIDRETMETVTDFIFLGSKMTADGDCSHETKRHLLLGRKAMTNLDSILRSNYFANKGPPSQSNSFSSSLVWMWELDFMKEAEHQRIDAFELWCWRRLLRVSWTARRSKQSILKEISPDHSNWKDWCWSWNSNTLTTDAKNWLFLKDPDGGKNWRWEEKGTTEDEMVGWHHWLDGHEFE